MEIVKNHPYQLCEIAGIGFKTADKIAMSMGFDLLSTERVDEGILYTLTDAEGKGNLCMEKHAFVKACLKMLDTLQLTEDMVANRAARLIYSGKLVSYQGNVYRSKQPMLKATWLNCYPGRCAVPGAIHMVIWKLTWMLKSFV